MRKYTVDKRDRILVVSHFPDDEMSVKALLSMKVGGDIYERIKA